MSLSLPGAAEAGGESLFAPATIAILDRFDINVTSSILNHDAAGLNAVGFDHAVVDSDGVLNPYGQTPGGEALNHVEQLAAGLEHGVSIVTNNTQLPSPVLPDNVRFLQPRSPLDFKPSPRLIRQAVAEAGAIPDRTIGYGDGLTDMLAYRFANLGGLCLVKSCGPHPAQEFVHKKIYTPLGALAGAILDKS